MEVRGSAPKAGDSDRVPVGSSGQLLVGLGLLSQDNLGVSRTGQKKSWILGEDWGGAALPCWVGFLRLMEWKEQWTGSPRAGSAGLEGVLGIVETQ